MINQLLARVQRPERGWDPVPAEHAASYSNDQWSSDTAPLTDAIEQRVGPLAGREVLDLGGGPGSYTLAFARRGARVTWFDVSAHYREIARRRVESAGEQALFATGYLEEAPGLGRRFDLVFNRICWYYSMHDRAFARIVHGLVAPGGWAHVVTPCIDLYGETSLGHRLRSRLNATTGFKIGHPFPTRRHFRRVWQGLECRTLEHGTSGRNATLWLQR